jgi:hypothetical protein
MNLEVPVAHSKSNTSLEGNNLAIFVLAKEDCLTAPWASDRSQTKG